MLTHLYIDNYKAFVNFELSFEPLLLLSGRNGNGKTGVFEVMGMLRRLLVEGTRIDDLLPRNTLTRWDSRTIQTFDVKIHVDQSEYSYNLEVEHQEKSNSCRIRHEHLQCDNKSLFETSIDQDGIYRGQLYSDDYSQGPEVLVDWTRSGVTLLQSRGINKKLIRFREAFSQILTISINPKCMQQTTEKEAVSPMDNMADFASWYKNLSQERPSLISHFLKDIEQLIDGFEELSLVPMGETVRSLRVVIRNNGSENNRTQRFNYEWAELSDGQKMLITLYALLHFAVGSGKTLIIDEPDNFVALAEIQPWLMTLSDKVRMEGGSQVILISHHPESYDYLAVDCGRILERTSGGPVRVHLWKSSLQTGLKPSEIVARGWENE